MKVLIAYDGSRCSQAAIDDLARAGLPPRGSAQVISVAETWLPPAESVGEKDGSSAAYLEELLRDERMKGEQSLAEAKMLVKFAEERVKTLLQDWDVTTFATYGSPAWEILNRAHDLDADLIVLGSLGHSALSRFILGSISQKVLTEAKCSVRISRGKIDIDEGPQRIIIGFDGSKGSVCAVDAVARRSWSSGSEILLVAATEPAVPSGIGRFVPPITKIVDEINVSEHAWLQKLADTALAKLRRTGMNAELCISPGNPKRILIEKAESWGADCIFTGANAWGSRLERVLLGSTSAAIAARAGCSVEVVRCSSKTERTELSESNQEVCLY